MALVHRPAAGGELTVVSEQPSLARRVASRLVGADDSIPVALTTRSQRSVALAAGITGDSQADVINRATQVYAYLAHVVAHDGEVLIRQPGGGELIPLRVSELPPPPV